MTKQKTKQVMGPSNIIFLGCSVDTKLKTGQACMLALSPEEYTSLSTNPQKKLNFITEKFLDTSPSRLELQTTLWAINSQKQDAIAPPITLCSNFRTMNNLLERRLKLEQTNYISTTSGLIVPNADLMGEFFDLYDSYPFNLLPPDQLDNDFPEKNNILFLINQATEHSRERLRLDVKEKTTDEISNKWF
ncbi:MAG: hypothetical protein ABII18_04330 [bacterium]